jgi:hypothetical protein
MAVQPSLGSVESGSKLPLSSPARIPRTPKICVSETDKQPRSEQLCFGLSHHPQSALHSLEIQEPARIVSPHKIENRQRLCRFRSMVAVTERLKASRPKGLRRGVASLSVPKVIPSAINLTEWCGPFRDQGDLGAYTRSPRYRNDVIPMAQIE